VSIIIQVHNIMLSHLIDHRPCLVSLTPNGISGVSYLAPSRTDSDCGLPRFATDSSGCFTGFTGNSLNLFTGLSHPASGDTVASFEVCSCFFECPK
jgi:hypothetical protein